MATLLDKTIEIQSNLPKFINIAKGILNKTKYPYIPYTELEYIKSTGTQWIDTGIKCKSNLKCEVKFSTQKISGGCFFGNSGSGESNSFRIFMAKNPDRWYLDFGSGEGGNRISGGNIATNTIYTIEVGNRYIKDKISGSNIISGSTVSFSDKTYTFHISNSGEQLTIYYCKLWDNNKLVRSFIPVKDENEVVCLYDKISNQYFYNAGTDNFIARR